MCTSSNHKTIKPNCRIKKATPGKIHNIELVQNYKNNLMLIKQLFIFLIFLTGATAAAAQNLSPTVISSSGGSGSADGTSLSWTTGELISQTFSADTLMLTQGFQQGEITVATAANELHGLSMDVNVYPNPVRNMLNIDFKGMMDQAARVKLMNLNGRVIFTREINNPSNITRINLDGNTPGTYMLEVSINGRSKTFKIVKH